MASKLKLYIGRRILDCIGKNITVTSLQLKPIIQVQSTNSNGVVELAVPLDQLEGMIGPANLQLLNSNIKPDDIIENIATISDQRKGHKNITFKINKNIFVKEIVEHCIQPDVATEKQNIVVEFSSPNVAKPFHVGHLRSTIIGNFIANLYEHRKHNVVRLNYLGDWGTQFGFIKVGIEELKHKVEEIQKNPLKILFESYVFANKLGEKDPSILERAKQAFNRLEAGSKEDLDNWKMCMQYTTKELDSMYQRLGVKFNEYNYESMYSAADIKNVLKELDANKILMTLEDGKRVANVNDRKVSVVKSDGSTLYLTRDIAAAIDRQKKFSFDKMIYVVDNAQTDHFVALKGILGQMKINWVDRLQHVKFGRIRGMSTRKGNVVFLKDILDETRELTMQRQLKSLTTKASITDSKTSDILGISCVIINDLKQRRQRDYDFSWDKALQVQGDSGIKLQYTHCRLCNLEKNCGILPASICKPEMILEPEALRLIGHLAKYPDILSQTEEQLEACILVTYLFHLCNHISKALKVLNVKDQEAVLASQRLLLFKNAREVLRQGMTILGLQPLKEM
ncbi:probable arginine--tRNA ligase, mitochondrial [Atheta coriaria]|uniref:probable arginine--tRNA ligase, mitochondrial n=1 Tax=Dalotia coriaria TaxID=877792 RepID=UPI0031F4325A